MKVAFLKTETATVLWDVERIERNYRNGTLKRTVKAMSVPDLVEQSAHVDYDFMGSDIGRLPIVVFLAKKKYRVLTGEEQLLKARALGFRNIKCCVLTAEEHKPYIIGYDEETYLRAVSEYWADEDIDDEPEEDE